MTPAGLHVHHDGSPLYVSTLSPRLGETLTLRLRTHRDQQPETVVTLPATGGDVKPVRGRGRRPATGGVARAGSGRGRRR